VADGAEEVAEAVAVGSLAEVTEAEAVAVVAAAESETKADLEKALRHARNIDIYCYTIFIYYNPCCRA
jgi:hypothetical protein